MRYVLVVILMWFSPAHADEQSRIRGHLWFAHGVLSARDVSALSMEQQYARAAALDDLARYIVRGEFPRRTGDAHGALQPRFIDDRGVHCAVGQMIADSGSEDLAQAINARFEYARVREIHEPALIAWASAHGFTVDELALIQPGYSAAPTKEGTKRAMDERMQDFTLTCAAKHAPMTSLLVYVTGEKSGRTTVTTKSSAPFAKCIVDLLSRVETGGGAYNRSPETYFFGLDIKFASPQHVLETLLARWQPSGCAPRPGPLTRSATVSVSIGREIAVSATTNPPNKLVEECVVEAARAALYHFAPGVWSLSTTKTVVVPPAVNVTKDLVANTVVEAGGTTCNPEQPPNTRVTIRVTAKPDDENFTVTVTGATGAIDEKFAMCVRDALREKLVEQFRTSYTPWREGLRYFRIDNRVDTTVTVTLETRAAREKRIEDQQKRLELETERRRYY